MTRGFPSSARGFGWFLLVIVLGSGSWLAKSLELDLEAEASSPFPVAQSPRFLSSLVGESGSDLALQDVFAPLERTVPRGQTLTGLFSDLGLDDFQSRAASRAAMKHLDPRQLRAGSSYTAYLHPSSEVQRVVFRSSEEASVVIRRTAEGWISDRRLDRIERREAAVHGHLDSALEASIRAAGAPGPLAYRLADVFQWDLDFSRDLRRGDRFQVLFEEVWVGGKRTRVGEVLAAIYVNRGTVHEAYRFGDEGYYDSEGRPLRRQFLRSPLPFSRVTSRFSHRRFHPILKVYRPHLGVDYGAPTGTPVRATAGGTVRSAGWTKGGGRTIKLRHPNGYVTAYLHLSGFAEGVRRGAKVVQGEMIGFVGATGLATAPHLDYRVEKNGEWINPLGLENEPAPPLSPAALQDFLKMRDRQRGRLRWPKAIETVRQAAAISDTTRGGVDGLASGEAFAAKLE